MTKESNALENIDLFIRQVDAISQTSEMRPILEAQIRRLGFDKFCYWLIWPPSGPRISFIISNYPQKWLEHYTKNGYRSDDLTGRYTALCNRPFSWEEVRKQYVLTPAQQRVFNEARDASLSAGASVPIRGPGAALAAFSVSNDMEQRDFESLFLENRHELHLIATYAHEKVMQLSFSKPTKSDIKLTAREVEVITWTARGKTRKETAEILNVSEDTVKQHLENSCMKLEASNKSHAVAKALQNGLISL